MAVAVAQVGNSELDAAIRAALAEKPDGILESVAKQAGCSLRDVLDRLPPPGATLISAERFEDVWLDLTGWGSVLFIVHTEDIVLECTGPLPAGSFGHGYYNVHGDSPISGHINAGNCAAIYAIDRPFHGRRSCSVQFLNKAGNAMFKVFVVRDANRELVPEQLAKFEALRGRLASVPI